MTANRTLRTWLAGVIDNGSLPTDLELRGDLRIDSRRVQVGDVFIALAGTARHGAEFARSAAKQGAVCILAEEKLVDLPAPLVVVPKIGQKLYALAERFYGLDWSQIGVIAITGTNGKSSIASQIAYAAERLGYGGCQIGTVHYAGPSHSEAARETTPHFVEVLRMLSLWQRAKSRLLLGIEASSHALDQRRLGDMPIDVAIMTNLSHDHLDYHSDVESYRRAKHKLFAQPRGRKAHAAVVPANDESLAAAQSAGRETTTFGDKNADFRVAAKALRQGHMAIQVDGRASAGWQIDAAGHFQALNSVASFAALLALGHDARAAARALGGWPGIAGRMELLIREPFLAFVDYAHTPAALESVLLSAREYVQPRSRLTCVFGCGGNRDPYKRPLMGATAEKFADRIILTNDNPRDEDPEQIMQAVVAGLVDPSRARIEPDRSAAIALALGDMRPGDVLVVAGKGHETGQIFANRTIHFDDREELRKWRSQ